MNFPYVLKCVQKFHINLNAQLRRCALGKFLTRYYTQAKFDVQVCKLTTLQITNIYLLDIVRF